MIKLAPEAILWAVRQLGRPAMFASVVVPCLIHSILLIGGLYLLYDWLSVFLFSIELWSLPDWLLWADGFFETLLDVVLWILLLGICLGVVGFGFTMTTTLAHFIASPFNGWLASSAEQQLRPLQHPQISLRQALLAGFSREWQRLRYWLWRALGLGLLTLATFWIPLVSSVMGLVWLGFGAWMLGLQSVDYVADNNGFSFKQTLALCQSHTLNVTALGGILLGMMVVPGLNLVSMAISVLAGTYLWVKKIEPEVAATRQCVQGTLN